MAKKDFTTTEEVTLSNDAEDKNENDVKTNEPESDSHPGQTEVKNAHAAGDGSFGRSEKLLSEENEEERGENAQNPPY